MTETVQVVPAWTPVPEFPGYGMRGTRGYELLAYAFGEHMSTTFNTQIAAMCGNVQHNAGVAASAAAQAVAKAAEAAGSVGAAASQVVLAQNQVALAAAAAAGAESAANATKWLADADYAQGDVVYSPITYTSYRRKIAGSGGVDPSINVAAWAPVTPVATSAIRSDVQITADADIALATSAAGAVVVRVIACGTVDVLILRVTAGLYAIAYDTTTGEFGPATLLQAGSAVQAAAIKINNDGLLLSYVVGTALYACVLSLDGLHVSAGTAATAAIASGSNLRAVHQLESGPFIIQVTESSSNAMIAASVSGQTVVLGALVRPYLGDGGLIPLGANSLVLCGQSSNKFRAALYTCSGTALAAGGIADTDITLSGGGIVYLKKLASGRIAALHYDTSTTAKVSVITVSGTAVSLTTTPAFGTVANSSCAAWVSGDSMLVIGNGRANVVTDVAGVATLGTQISVPTTVVGYDAGGLLVGPNADQRVGISGGNPTITAGTVRAAFPSVVIAFGAMNGFALPWYTRRSASGRLVTLSVTGEQFGISTLPAGYPATTQLPRLATISAHPDNESVAWSCEPALTPTTVRLVRVEV